MSHSGVLFAIQANWVKTASAKEEYLNHFSCFHSSLFFLWFFSSSPIIVLFVVFLYTLPFL